MLLVVKAPGSRSYSDFHTLANLEAELLVAAASDRGNKVFSACLVDC